MRVTLPTFTNCCARRGMQGLGANDSWHSYGLARITDGITMNHTYSALLVQPSMDQRRSRATVRLCCREAAFHDMSDFICHMIMTVRNDAARHSIPHGMRQLHQPCHAHVESAAQPAKCSASRIEGMNTGRDLKEMTRYWQKLP